jgi:hypothetical protein
MGSSLVPMNGDAEGLFERAERAVHVTRVENEW